MAVLSEFDNWRQAGKEAIKGNSKTTSASSAIFDSVVVRLEAYAELIRKLCRSSHLYCTVFATLANVSRFISFKRVPATS
jgi:hypothetical protein